jgi:hypothetical protein
MSPLDKLILSLSLVRIGQELGTDTPLARAVAALIEAAIITARGG